MYMIRSRAGREPERESLAEKLDGGSPNLVKLVSTVFRLQPNTPYGEMEDTGAADRAKVRGIIEALRMMADSGFKGWRLNGREADQWISCERVTIL